MGEACGGRGELLGQGSAARPQAAWRGLKGTEKPIEPLLLYKVYVKKIIDVAMKNLMELNLLS